MNEYQKKYINFLRPFLNPAKSLKVVADCSNGTVGPIVQQLTTNNRQLITKIINEKPDGNFPAHSPDPLHKGASEQLEKEVIKNKADLGIIFDGDGDRVFFMDNLGRLMDTTTAAYLLALRLKPRKMIVNSPIGWLIKKNLKSQILNLKIETSKVGRSYLEKIMEEKDADFGCEFSGHYCFKNFFYRDSGIMAAIEFINAVSRLPYKLSDFNDLLMQYYKHNANLRMYANTANKIKKIEEEYKKDAVKISKEDGLMMEFKDFWFLLRPSNTESVLRIYMEAENEHVLVKEWKKVLNVIKSSNNESVPK